MKIEKFTEDEMKCKCGCGFIIKSKKHIEKLTAARIISEVPYKITSWCRCYRRNKDEGGEDTSSHRIGEATDIYTKTPFIRFKVLYGLIMAGFKRIGIGPDFIHADSDSDKSQLVIWVY